MCCQGITEVFLIREVGVLLCTVMCVSVSAASACTDWHLTGPRLYFPQAPLVQITCYIMHCV